MDQETLYTATKWDILKHLEGANYSPIELSKLTGGSIANVSQQLRLLEMAGIVKSERVSNRDKGQPRVRYSLAQDSCYVINTANNFVEKKRLATTPSHQVVLRIWFLENQELRTYTEKAFWKIEEHLPSISELYVDVSSMRPISFYVVAEKKLDIPHIQDLRHGDERRQVTVTQLSQEQLEKLGGALFKLY